MKNEKLVARGAVIPYIIEDDEVLMMFMKPSDPKFGGKAFQIAKGKIEAGETPEDGAFREAQEELGLFMPNVIEKYDLGKFGRIHVFVAKIRDQKLFGDPDDETGDVRWMTPGEFQAEGRDWQRPIVKAAVRLIRKKEGLNGKA